MVSRRVARPPDLSASASAWFASEHATGAGGKTMESLIADGYIVGSLDITTTELADTVCGGVFDAGSYTRGLYSRGVE